MYVNFDCPWYNFDNSYRTLLGACIIIFGLSGVFLNIWMIITFIQSHLLSYKSHLLILNLSATSLARGILGGFLFSGPSAIMGRWLFGSNCCKLFAFMHNLLGIFQIISLTVLCLERYLIIKRMKYGKEFGIKFYAILIVFCWLYSIVFAIPPLLSYGTYGCDITGTSCTLDWRCSNTQQSSFNILMIIIIFLPVIVIIFSLWKAVTLNKKQRLVDTDYEQWSLTKTTVNMTCIVLLFWVPQTILAIWIMITSWDRSLKMYKIPAVMAILAPLCSEASTMVPLLSYLAGEPRIRTALLGRCKKNYGIIKKGKKSTDFTIIPNE